MGYSCGRERTFFARMDLCDIGSQRLNLRDLEARVREFAAHSVPSLASGRALIAVSGGGDSIATAAMLCEAGVVDPAQSVVAHFDHRRANIAINDFRQRFAFQMCGD